MSRFDLTFLTMIVDRSGSMSTVRDDAQGAINQFIEDQVGVPGVEAVLRLVEFDARRSYNDGIDDDWYNVVHAGDIADCPTYRLHPRGGTALFDAIGRALAETAAQIDELADAEKPEHVIVIVQTDGHENASREWTLDALKKAIADRTDEGWQFLYLGMGPDSFGQDEALGIAHGTRSAATGHSHYGTYTVANMAVENVRLGLAKDLSEADVNVDAFGNVTAKDDD